MSTSCLNLDDPGSYAAIHRYAAERLRFAVRGMMSRHALTDSAVQSDVQIDQATRALAMRIEAQFWGREVCQETTHDGRTTRVYHVCPHVRDVGGHHCLEFLAPAVDADMPASARLSRLLARMRALVEWEGGRLAPSAGSMAIVPRSWWQMFKRDIVRPALRWLADRLVAVGAFYTFQLGYTDDEMAEFDRMTDRFDRWAEHFPVVALMTVPAYLMGPSRMADVLDSLLREFDRP